MKVLFHCNATRATGAGHVIRSIALAEAAMEANHQVLFAGTYESGFAVDALRRRAVPLRDYAGTASDLVALAEEVRADIIHCDSYTAPPGIHETAREHGVLLSNLEDGSHGRRGADIIIDPSPDADRRYREGASSGLHVRGLRFVPLRKAIAQVVKDRGARQQMPSARPTALIMMGGTDAAGISESVLALWASAFPHSECYVVKPDLDDARVERIGTCTVRWVGASEDVITLFTTIDAAVSAAGTTVWELLAAGVPTAVLTQAENQQDNYNFLTSRSLMLPLGDAHSVGARAKDTESSLSQLVNFHPQTDLEIDAHGARRIVDEWEFISSLPSHRVELRKARISDASNLFCWRNDATVRSMSRDSKHLEWDEHLNWLRRTLGRPDRHLFIAHLARDVIGTVRFDALDSYPGSWEISIALNPAMRGRSLGGQLLARAEQALREQVAGGLTLVAQVRRDNNPSMRLFQNAGYVVADERNTADLAEWRKSLPN